jgi:hypothetical protein
VRVSGSTTQEALNQLVLDGSPLAVPVVVFEIILLPTWLLFRGFEMPEQQNLRNQRPVST